MNKFLIFINVLCITFSIQAGACSKNPEEFANYLQAIVARGDKISFQKLLALQLNGEASKAEQIDYVFNSQLSNIRTMLMDEETKVFVKPFINLDGEATNKFLIVYYNPTIIDFTKPVSLEQLGKHWQSGYIETAIELVNDKWFFIDSAFYQGSSPSWFEDY
ncbi:hypothetical protein LP316_13290 [Thalassotalea sp. LPB0316]|uniref:hypothetical protein n=1 Tax=Thalassotalea sp. LPB0316 TaxID=2769490 RepID=UPI0018696901|nr:hypothetical protein [Thalassotalea sp. LPB0316]QOL25258.1 hypothetical protein LP316_13290 [Thalassotalea sp. LPB0316]